MGRSSGIQSSLPKNCHHQIVFAKCNLKTYYPQPYEREIWNFKKTNTDHIKRVINGFPWEMSFANLDINEKVCLFNKTIKNILSNFIRHETILFDNRDPPWINSQVKHLTNEKILYTKIILKITIAINLLQRFSPFRVN